MRSVSFGFIISAFVLLHPYIAKSGEICDKEQADLDHLLSDHKKGDGTFGSANTGDLQKMIQDLAICQKAMAKEFLMASKVVSSGETFSFFCRCRKS